MAANTIPYTSWFYRYKRHLESASAAQRRLMAEARVSKFVAWKSSHGYSIDETSRAAIEGALTGTALEAFKRNHKERVYPGTTTHGLSETK